MGFMAITQDVNVSLLNECFELRPFHGLCKPHPDDDLNPPSLDDIDEGEETKSKIKFVNTNERDLIAPSKNLNLEIFVSNQIS